MSYLHYFFIVNFTLRIYQSYGFLPFPIRKLIEIRNTVMDTNYYIRNNTDKGSFGPVSSTSKASKTVITRSGKYFSKVTLSAKSKPFYINRYANSKIKDLLTVGYRGTASDTTNTLYILITDDYSIEALPRLGVIGIKRTVNKNDMTQTLALSVIGITRTINGITRSVPQPSTFKHNTDSLPIPKVTDIGQNEKVTEASDTYYKTKDQEVERRTRVLYSRANFLKFSRSPTASFFGIPGAIKDLDSGEIGPIRVLIKDDTYLEPDYLSYTQKPYKIAFFDITKAKVEDDKTGDLFDDAVVVRRTLPFDRLSRVTRTLSYDRLDPVTRTLSYDRLDPVTRTSPYDGLYQVTKTSPYDGLYRVTRPSRMSTVYRVLPNRTHFRSNDYFNDMVPVQILMNDDVNSKNDYNIEYEKDDFSVSPSVFAIKQDSWEEKLPWAYDEFPETKDDSMSASRTSQMTTYDNGSLSHEKYSSYALSLTWPTFTIRNYFAQFLSTQSRSNARTDSLRTQAPFTFSHLRSRNDKDVTKQIKYLTGVLLRPISRKIVLPKKQKARKLNDKPKKQIDKDIWECYDCGMNEVEFGQPDCYNTFDNPNHKRHYIKSNHTKRCTGSTKYHRQCFKRYLDVGTTYDERGCRTYPPASGRSYASQKFVRLEYLLKKTKNGCVSSPHAILMPFSRTIQLYVHFHVCVCEGRRCNIAASIVFNWTTSLSMIMYFVI